LSGLRHGERTKAAIAERQKFSGLLKMLRAGELPSSTCRPSLVTGGGKFDQDRGSCRAWPIGSLSSAWPCTARIVLAVVLLDTLCDGKFVCYL
jgi:hypothetical protein